MYLYNIATTIRLNAEVKCRYRRQLRDLPSNDRLFIATETPLLHQRQRRRCYVLESVCGGGAAVEIIQILYIYILSTTCVCVYIYV